MNVVSTSSPVATQIPHAAGLALAMKLRGDDRVALTCIGEGSTSQGEWYEGLNWAAVHQLPFICLVQNNVYAISVPVDQQMNVPNVADRAAAFGLPGVVVDGNDVLAVTDYGIRYPSICARRSVCGVQFHPEKSQDAGLRLLANFAAMP